MGWRLGLSEKTIWKFFSKVCSALQSLVPVYDVSQGKINTRRHLRCFHSFNLESIARREVAIPAVVGERDSVSKRVGAVEIVHNIELSVS